MCFITPKRLRCGKASTISVVVRGPFRRRAKIARLVLSDSAFHTPSSSSAGTLAPLRVLGAILGASVQHLLPAAAHALPVCRIDEADGAVTEVHMGCSRPLF